MLRVFIGSVCTVALYFSTLHIAFASPPYDTFVEKVAALEQHYGGRLGVALYRTKDDTWYTYRGDERFPLCSVFKVVAVADLLKRSESDPALLQTRFPVQENAILPFSFAIRKYLKSGISLKEIAESCLVVSDNTAANMLLRALGGPAAVTAFAHALGHTEFRLDRWEMEMNDSTPGDERDTVSPLAMTKLLHKIVLGDVLAASTRAQLTRWMINCMTGEKRLAAGTPRAWTVAQKTGTGDYGTTNAIGVLWPPVGYPLVLSVFYTQDSVDAEARSDLIATIAQLATQPQQD
ncbi:MAG: class A beta-lactamase [Desulfovibrionaceae bacterium]